MPPPPTVSRYFSVLAQSHSHHLSLSIIFANSVAVGEAEAFGIDDLSVAVGEAESFGIDDLSVAVGEAEAFGIDDLSVAVEEAEA
ncbi:hypothetical protein Ccrd_022090 [Cynara cardunculus var. scolymus]|uniref:Uncharacterized protein n=1 Tax=Cynara cardunculus var. scolymus TaxID=59895 RepID=A0A103XZB5_CYNCS|nr:hypothetical protein Ccrd_022090 [Cynara cardunculus var. scolymus]